MNRFIAAALPLQLLLSGRTLATALHLVDEVSTDSVTVETVSTSTGLLDGPKILETANDTTYEWWYFDAVSRDTNESIVIVFYNSGGDGFVNPWWYEALSVSVTGTFANGTLYNLVAGSSGGADVVYSEAGISVNYTGAGISFTGTNITADEVTYAVTLDSEEIGVSGTINFTSRAPATYACNLNEAGSDETIMPHVYWANALPDATASVAVTFADGTAMTFADGVGYHDKNWGDEPFANIVSSWYWGHAHLGPYSLVFFSTIDLDGAEYVSGFVAADGDVDVASCAAGVVTLRPWGANDTYPPTATSGVMQGLEVVFDLGDGSELAANVTRGTIVMDYSNSVYIRALGTVTGGVVGGETYTDGRAMFEQFALAT